MHTVNTQKTQQNPVYMPYGFAPAAASALVTYNGERYDVSSKGYLLGNGYRLYLPSLMRFTSPDSIAPFGTLNDYSYCGGDPVNHIDPSGHFHINSHVASRIWRKTNFAKRSEALDLQKAATLKAFNELQRRRQQFKEYQSAPHILRAKIKRAKENIGMAESYGDWSEYSRYEKKLRDLRGRLNNLPKYSPDELHALQESELNLEAEFFMSMREMDLPRGAEGVKKLEPITPMNIRQDIPLQRVRVSADGNFMIRRSDGKEDIQLA